MTRSTRITGAIVDLIDAIIIALYKRTACRDSSPITAADIAAIDAKYDKPEAGAS